MKVINLKKSIFFGKRRPFPCKRRPFPWKRRPFVGNGDLLLETETFFKKKKTYKNNKKKKKKKFLGCLKNSEEISMRSMK